MPRKSSKKAARANKARNKAIAATSSNNNSSNDNNYLFNFFDYFFAHTLSLIQACLVLTTPISMALTCFMFNYYASVTSVTSVTLATSVYICIEGASFFVGLLTRLSKRRRRLIPRSDTLIWVIFFSLLALLIVVNAAGEGTGNNPNSWNLTRHNQFIRENYGNFFTQIMAIILYWRRFGRGPDPEDEDDEEWPVECRLSFTRYQNRSVCIIQGLSFLVSYMGQVTYSTHSAIGSWMKSFTKNWGFFEVDMSDSYEGTDLERASLWSSVTNRFAFSNELYDFDEPLTNALQHRIENQRGYRSTQSGAFPYVVYNFWHKAIFYVREFVWPPTATPSLFTAEKATSVGEYLNNGNRLQSVEPRLNALKIRYAADRSEPVEDYVVVGNTWYAIICKSRRHAVDGFNEEAYEHG